MYPNKQIIRIFNQWSSTQIQPKFKKLEMLTFYSYASETSILFSAVKINCHIGCHSFALRSLNVPLYLGILRHSSLARLISGWFRHSDHEGIIIVCDVVYLNSTFQLWINVELVQTLHFMKTIMVHSVSDLSTVTTVRLLLLRQAPTITRTVSVTKTDCP